VGPDREASVPTKLRFKLCEPSNARNLDGAVVGTIRVRVGKRVEKLRGQLCFEAMLCSRGCCSYTSTAQEWSRERGTTEYHIWQCCHCTT
jgi:hypothetical protein